MSLEKLTRKRLRLILQNMVAIYKYIYLYKNTIYV